VKKRKTIKPVFKPYAMGQMLLLPQSYEEVISEDHLVRVVNHAVEQIDVESPVGHYAGGEPRAMIRRCC
jgi:hypothetical protein